MRERTDYTVRVNLVLLSTGQAAKTIETITRQVREIDTGKERESTDRERRQTVRDRDRARLSH